MKVKVLVTGSRREITSANGRKHIFSDIWVSFPGLPYPAQVDHYGAVELPAGEYDVPLNFEVRDRRPGLRFDFSSATAVKQVG